MLSLYRAWLGPSPCVARPVPPPGAHRPVPRRAKLPSPSPSPPPPPASPSPSTTSSELDVEKIEADPPKRQSNTILDIASCDGPVKFSRVLNVAWREPSPESEWQCRHRKQTRTTLHYYPCKTCGSKFPSYYFVHKHRKRCHADEAEGSPGPSTSSA